jgi:hypothetical protein
MQCSRSWDAIKRDHLKNGQSNQLEANKVRSTAVTRRGCLIFVKCLFDDIGGYIQSSRL